jgi:hypothetical protein
VDHPSRVERLIELVKEIGEPGRGRKEQEAQNDFLQNGPPSGA